jgi:hypothetical protein
MKELRALTMSMQPGDFRKQLGPFVLVRKPPGDDPDRTDKMGLPASAQRTTMVHPDKAQAGMLALVFQFEELAVATVPPLHENDELTVGRQPDCDLVLDDPSVSKTHALLCWDEAKMQCSIKDLQSTNGTFLNGATRVHNETLLRDGDILSFGEVQYWYMLTGTLVERLRQTTTQRAV